METGESKLGRFSRNLEKRCLTLQVENQMDVNIFNNKLVNEIIQSAEEVKPKSIAVRYQECGGIMTVKKL